MLPMPACGSCTSQECTVTKLTQTQSPASSHKCSWHCTQLPCHPSTVTRHSRTCSATDCASDGQAGTITEGYSSSAELPPPPWPSWVVVCGPPEQALAGLKGTRMRLYLTPKHGCPLPHVGHARCARFAVHGSQRPPQPRHERRLSACPPECNAEHACVYRPGGGRVTLGGSVCCAVSNVVRAGRLY